MSDAASEIAKLRREQYGHSSDRRARLIDQMELQLEELEAAATEDEIAAKKVAKTTTVAGLKRRRPARKPFPEHLPRERVVIAAPTACSCCGSDRIVKMGEDITEALEVIPRQWKVIQTVREKFTCRHCEKISQPPAPFHPTPRGWAGPNLLAMILFEKFGQHQPLNRQAERYAKEGVEISLSTLADQVGACAAALAPIHALIRAHVLEAERLHGTGVAAGIRGAPIAQSAARVALTGQGRLSVFSDMTDLGTGSYTVLAQTAAEMMGLAIDQIDVHLADTDHPTSTGSLGQRGAISSASAVYAACDRLRAKIAGQLGLNHDEMVFEDGGIIVADRRISLADLPAGLGAEAEMTYGDLSEQYAHQTFAAHFAEVAVHELTGEIRVRRLSSTCACGRILNPKTARSQILGAQIQGLGAALFEGLDVDTGAGFFVNHDLAGYEVPTHMDAPLQDVAFIEEEDATVSVLKAKGVGEIGICGVPAAIANAVFDATGKRFRSYPINVAAVTDML